MMKIATLRTGGIFTIGEEWDMMSNYDDSYLMGVLFWDTHSSINFGNPRTRKTFNSYILQLPNGEYRYVINPKEWNHLCFAWASGRRSKVVLVNIMIILQSKIWVCKGTKNFHGS